MGDVHTVSKVYAWVQTALLVAFAAVALFGRSPLLVTSTFVRDLGTGLCALGIALMVAAFVPLREVIQVAPEPKTGGRLVTNGIYRFLRHPVYTAILMLVIGIVLRRPTLFAGIAAAAVIVFLFLKTRYEESLLLARYPQYAGYRKQSWGLIPGLR